MVITEGRIKVYYENMRWFRKKKKKKKVVVLIVIGSEVKRMRKWYI